jgi:hypothetical protein
VSRATVVRAVRIFLRQAESATGRGARRTTLPALRRAVVEAMSRLGQAAETLHCYDEEERDRLRAARLKRKTRVVLRALRNVKEVQRG